MHVMVIYGAGAAGVLVRLECPHCGEVQARASKPRDERYRCRKCHRLFTREEAEAAEKRSSR